MREIKYKAYVKESREIGLVEKIDFWLKTVSVLLQEYEVTYKFDEVELLQYTGLKDKYGKEIYEGDILQFSGFVVTRGLVKYDEIFCCFQACHNMSCWLLGKERGVEIEVISNIYKNPEPVEGE